MERFLCILIFLLSFGDVCYSQTISVRAYLEEGDAAIGASIQLLLQKDKFMFDFAILEHEAGYFFRDIPPDNYLLRLKFFGYRDTTIQFNIGEGEELNFRFNLEPIVYNLPNVSVVDKIIGFKQNGDTLRYNLKAYLSGTEQNLGDVLVSLPGIELDYQGNVKVENNKVDAILINGKDIINSQHRLATQGIQSDLIESVELIQNYREQGELFEGIQTTDKWAVNVILIDEAQKHWSGNAKFFLGMNRRVSTELNLFKATKSQGWSLFLRQNNIGDKPIEQPASLLLEEVTRRNEYAIDQVNHKFLLDYTIAPSLGTGVTDNNDYHFAISGDIKNRKGFQNRLYATGTYGQRMSSMSYQRNYFDLSLQERLMTDKEVILPFLYLRNKLSFKTKKHFTEVILPFQYYSKRKNETQEGSFGLDSFTQLQDDRLDHFSFGPQVNYFRKFKYGFVFEFSQKLNYEQLNEGVSITSQTPFLQFEDNGQISYNFEQDTRFKSSRNTSTISLAKYWERNLLKYELSFASDRASVDNISNNFFGGFQGRLSTRVFQHGFKGVKEWNHKLKLIGILSQVLVRQRLDEKQYQQHYILPEVLLYAEYYRHHAFSVSIRQEAEIPGFFYYNNYAYVKESRTLAVHNLDPQMISRTQSYTFSLFKKPIAGGNLYNLSLGYANLYESFVTTIEVKENFVKKGWIVVPKARRRFVDAFLQLQAGKWKINAFANLKIEDGFASRKGILVAMARNILNFNLRVSSVRWHDWQLSLALENTSNWQQVETSQTSFIMTTVKGRLNYTRKKWNFQFDFNQLFQRSKFRNNRIANINLDVAYSLNTHWKFYIDANNLLNLISTTQIDVSFNPNYEQLSTFGTFPGQILLGAGYFF